MPTATVYENTIGLSIRDVSPSRIRPEAGLSVFVVFTSLNGTMKALEKAREMAQASGAQIVIVALQVVPFPLPLDRPPIRMEFVVRSWAEKARGFPEKLMVFVYLCRDPLVALKSILSPGCPVVMDIRNKWWPTRDERLARKLRGAGFEVIVRLEADHSALGRGNAWERMDGRGTQI